MAERIDDLILGGFKIIQNPEEFCFSIDAILLAHFPVLKKGFKVIDLGTGTGVIPLVLVAREQALGKVIGLEYQQQMVNMAQRSVALNKLQTQIEIIQGDIRNLNAAILKEKFDLVVTNPPYKPIGQGKLNPRESIAIARHELKVSLSEVIGAAAKLLKHGGKLAMVHLPERLGDIIYYFRENKLEPKRMQVVHPMPGKKAKLLLIEGVLGAGKGLEILEPLYIYETDGVYTKKILDFYGLTGGETLKNGSC